MEINQQLEKLKDRVSEVGMIGSLLLNPEFMLRTEYFKPRMLSYLENSTIFYVVGDLYKQGITEIDDYMIVSQIEASSKLKGIFDNIRNINSVQDYLISCRCVGRKTLDEYMILVKRLMTLSYKREIILEMSSLINTCVNDEEATFSEVNMLVQEGVTTIAEKYIADGSIQTIGEQIDDIMQQIIDRRLENGMTGLPSAWNSVSERFTYEDGELYCIGGRAKSGKSVFLQNEVIHKLRNGIACAVFDTELSTRLWFERLAASMASVTVKSFKSGTCTDEENARVNKELEWLRKQPLVHIYDPNWTKDKIYTKAKILKIKMDLGFLVYDYIKANSASDLKIQEAAYLGDLTSFLKNDIAGTLNIPVLTAGQMSPSEVRLADSAKISRYASYICYWMQKSSDEIIEDGNQSGTHKFIIDFARSGGGHLEGEYLNFILKGDYCQIYEAKIKNKSLNNFPFEDEE